MTLEELAENYPESILADGFHEAIIGFDELGGRVIYSIEKVLDILMDEQGMNFDEAWEYFEYNMRGAYVGAKTPVWSMPVDVEL